MNDLTLDQVEIGEEVFFFLKPSDKLPHCISTIIDKDFDYRGRPGIVLKGINFDEFLPIYQIKKLPEDASLIRQYSAGLKDFSVEIMPGLDY